MATITHAGTLPDSADKSDFYALIDGATITGITNAEINQITTAGKVSGAAVTSLGSVPAGAGNLPTANCPVTITLPDQGSAPTTAANTGAVYCKAVSGASELFFREESDGDEVQITSGGALASGSVAQTVVKFVQTVVSGVQSKVIPWDDSKPQNDEGIEITTQAFTPISASNNILITASFWGGNSGGGKLIGALFVDTTANALAASASQADDTKPEHMTVVYSGAASSTDARTYKLRVGSDQAGTITVNGISGGQKFDGAGSCSITIMEIVP